MSDVQIPIGEVKLEGELIIPPGARGLVVFVHGSGSSRHSRRNHAVARVIRESGNGTLLFDLLTPEEEAQDEDTAQLRFDIRLLASRLVAVTHWLAAQPAARDLGIGYFGSSTGGAAALVAAAEDGMRVDAVVSRGGRPDLAYAALLHVEAPTLLIVGGEDDVVIGLNEQAFAKLRCKKELKIMPGATHLFEEPGALESVAQMAADWFREHSQIHGPVRDQRLNQLNRPKGELRAEAHDQEQGRRGVCAEGFGFERYSIGLDLGHSFSLSRHGRAVILRVTRKLCMAITRKLALQFCNQMLVGKLRKTRQMRCKAKRGHLPRNRDHTRGV